MDQERLFFSSVNYQALFNMDSSDASVLSEKHHRYLSENDALFYQRLCDIKEVIPKLSSEIELKQLVKLSGWDSVIRNIRRICDNGNGCLIALFHYGPHRNILVDLALQGIPVSSPIATTAYQKFYEIKNIAPKIFSECLDLLSVNDFDVGRKVIKSLKNRRVVAIYVDGNMGPDGIYAEEGSEIIEFSTLKIRAKSGIVRLSHKFRCPIIPVFSYSSGNKSFVSSGEEINVETGLDYKVSLENLYHQLFCKMEMAPEQWEYAACLQRWRVKGEISEQHFVLKSCSGIYSLNSGVRVFKKSGVSYLVNPYKNSAVKLPSWFEYYLDFLLIKESFSDEDLEGGELLEKRTYILDLCNHMYLKKI